jgi:hypothetical protein
MESTQQDAAQDAAQAAINVLAKSSVRELRQLHVDRNANKLQLSGIVRSFYHKQLAQETVRSVAAGMQLVNRVSVCA